MKQDNTTNKPDTMDYTEFDYILTPLVDTKLKEHHSYTRTLLGTDSTEEEKELLKDAESNLNDDLEYIREIQEDLVKYLRKEGCNCIDKYL